ncbi:SAM-dependent methyltransferase [Pedobacter alpinus]|uniref:SAM-dependent methyltransferase n=1 Tax=Pedobacter alpinus TaxID=1590643 RepID=A0ABW5TVS0_9SPHI
MKNLDANYWNSRYLNQQTGWDLGEVSPPIKNYIDQLENKNLKILIPGAGNAYEAIYLLENGFTNITVVDFAQQALDNLNLKLKAINIAHYQLIMADFFEHMGAYDLILEQTFFCAIDPKLRENYSAHVHQILAKNGKLAGLLFNREFASEGPPFGGSKEEYVKLFSKNFDFKIMEEAYNSIDARKSTELFFVMTKK